VCLEVEVNHRIPWPRADLRLTMSLICLIESKYKPSSLDVFLLEAFVIFPAEEDTRVL
jgi:hypothetical protein